MNQQDMLDDQWSEDTGLFGFSDSDWYKDAKDVLNFGFMLNNADKLQTANQKQADLMYTVPTETQPNARYSDPRRVSPLPLTSSTIGGIESKYLLLGGVAVLAFLAFK